MKVMLVDDDRTMRTILKTLLELEKYNVVVWDALPTSDILEQIRAEKPDLVLMDVHLREINGLDILHELRLAEPQIAETRVLMTSGMDLRDQCKTAGADGFLLKPYMPDELMQQIRSLAAS
jgi:CheY-like chemotaxis protein